MGRRSPGGVSAGSRGARAQAGRGRSRSERGSLVSVRDPRIFLWLLPSSVAVCDSQRQDSRLEAAASLSYLGEPRGAPPTPSGRRRSEGRGAGGQTLKPLSSDGLPGTPLCRFERCGQLSALIETYFPKALFIDGISNVLRFELARTVTTSHLCGTGLGPPLAISSLYWQQSVTLHQPFRKGRGTSRQGAAGPRREGGREGGRGRDRREKQACVVTLRSPDPPRCSPLPPTWRGLEVGRRVSLSTGGQRRKPHPSHTGGRRAPAHRPRRPRLSRLPWQRHPPTPGDHLRFHASAPAPGFLAQPPSSRGERLGRASASGQKVSSVCVTAPRVWGSLEPALRRTDGQCPQTGGAPKAEPKFYYLCNGM